MNYHHVIAEIPGSFNLKFERIDKNLFRISYGCMTKDINDVDLASLYFSKCLLHLAELEGKLEDVKELFDL
jgi:hypothetical protein